MNVFALRHCHLLTQDLEGEYIRKVRLYRDYYEALGRFIILNDAEFEIQLYLHAFYDHLREDGRKVDWMMHDLIVDLIYDTDGDVLWDTPYNKPANLMTTEKRQNIHQLFEKHQIMRKAQYERQMAGVSQERPYVHINSSAAE
ncbi:hypothetical protein KFE96_07935 [Kordiimonas sp. SCSIO 12603]|uniref:hypothetical protein n=1 Tax=Kordiimonas sp. SCSIO 12603 TaxID=2829596 RepID=UPI0021080A38|nr:hypothetical protein [Kordiimonas sp. SCSIO 12603]UTW60231.1 hypothetical protein KFE96_07935 [Kordiimonas sp. SCSIO 12603]